MSGARDPLAAQVELLKLARLLGCTAEALAFLADAPEADLRELREQVTDHLFDANRRLLDRMAAAGRVVPVPLLARLAHTVFGALLCARIAGRFEPGRAAEVAERLPTPFLADVAAELDPRRAVAVIERIATERLLAVAGELAARGDTVTMGRFVGHLRPDVLAAAVGALEPETLLRTAFVLEGKERLPEIVALLDAERRAAVVRAAVEGELWAEAVELLINLGDAEQRELARIASSLDGGERSGLAAYAEQLGVVERLGPFMDALRSA